MTNIFVGNDNEPSANGNNNWHRSAGSVFKYGLAIGVGLIMLGGISLNLSLTNALLEMLVVCTGLGIILGAFGSTAKATIPGQSIVLVGVAATTVALFFLVPTRQRGNAVGTRQRPVPATLARLHGIPTLARGNEIILFSYYKHHRSFTGLLESTGGAQPGPLHS